MEGKIISNNLALKGLLLAGAATMLQDCTAAVVPIAAGGLMGGSVATRGGDNDQVEVAVPTETDAVVIVDSSTNLADESIAVAAETGPSARLPLATESTPAPEPVAPASAEIAAAQPEPAASLAEGADIDMPESATAEFGEAFATPSNSIASSEAFEAADTEVAVPEQAPPPVSALPSQVEETPVRRIDVDSSIALADASAATSSVSAAQAAAALTQVELETEPAAPAIEPAPTKPAAAPTAVEVESPSAVDRAAELADLEEVAAPVEGAAGSALAEVVATTVPATTVSSVLEPTSQSVSAVAPATTPVSNANAITSLISYANQRDFAFAPGETRKSAMLVDRIKLGPDRADCIGIEPTVLIDLDPEDGIFSPADAGRPPAGLATGLARLRAAGVAIAWISGGSSSYSEIYRDALARSGLDESGADQLLLMRGPDDRKQIRREQLAQLTCLIAIAGDTRSDFDELYDYLLNPGDAAVLEPIIGEGWFLIPTPLLSERPKP